MATRQRSRPSLAAPAQSRLGAMLERGIALQRTRRYREAEHCYQLVLREEPDNPDALNLMGTLAVAAHRMDASIDCLKRAVALRPKDAIFRNNLGNAYLFDKAPESAVPHLKRALSLVPGFPEAVCNLGRAYRMLGRTDEALALFEKALKQRPGMVEALVGRGEAEVDLGAMTQARETFRAVLRQNPRAAQAYAGLASAHRFRPGDEEIAALGAVIDEGGLSDREMVVLLHAAAKIHDDIGDHDTAFAHLSRAKALMNARFDIQAYRAYVDRLCERFTRAFFAERADFGVASGKPVFIVGMPRSGTTLVEQIVASHPQAHGAGELGDIQRLADTLAGTRRLTAEHADGVADLTRRDARRMAQDYLGALTRRAPNAARVADKMPHNFQLLGLVALLLPGARVIHCRRDPLDTCLSCYLQHFNRTHAYNTDLEALGLYYREHDRLMAHWRAHLPLAMMEVRYENLVSNQETVTRRIVDFLELEWDDACLSFHETERTVRTPSRWQVRQPIYSSSVGRWRGYERHLAPLRAALGDLVE